MGKQYHFPGDTDLDDHMPFEKMRRKTGKIPKNKIRDKYRRHREKLIGKSK